MHTWFCPECGREYELGDCAVGRVFGLKARLHCPDCHRRVRVTGPAVFVATLLVLLLACLFFDGFLPLPWQVLPLVIAAGGIVAVLRIAQQVRAQGRPRRHRDSHDRPEDDPPG
jgi:peptidoglycan/LPS O-acetylase OafA/YrhL